MKSRRQNGEGTEIELVGASSGQINEVCNVSRSVLVRELPKICGMRENCSEEAFRAQFALSVRLSPPVTFFTPCVDISEYPSSAPLLKDKRCMNGAPQHEELT